MDMISGFCGYYNHLNLEPSQVFSNALIFSLGKLIQVFSADFAILKLFVR